MIDAVFTVIVQTAFSLLFGLAGLEKLRNRTLFMLQLEQYQLLPKSLVQIIGNTVILLEISAAILLLFLQTFYGVVIGVLLLACYAFAIGKNLFKGRSWIDCGCLGSDGEGLSYWLVLRNMVLAAILSIALIPATNRDFIWLDYFSIVFTVLAAALAYILINTLLAASMRSNMWWSE